jgi:decaprenyl-phosphate phosphoribosyltransferase
MSLTTIIPPPPVEGSGNRVAAHFHLFRLDHTVKQIFVLPGIVIAASLTGATPDKALLVRALFGLAAVIAAAATMC